MSFVQVSDCGHVIVVIKDAGKRWPSGSIAIKNKVTIVESAKPNSENCNIEKLYDSLNLEYLLFYDKNIPERLSNWHFALVYIV